MRRLITGAITTLLSLIVLTAPALAAERFTSTTVSQPSATSNHSLNVAFQVFSTLATDDQFGVQLFENNVLKASQEINHPYGNSGTFTVELPATGTYSYFVKSINHDNGDAAQDSETVNVQITNAPQPIVTTVNAAGAAAGGGGGGTAGGLAAAGTTVAGDLDGDGKVDDSAASTNKEAKDVLGAETKKDDGNKSESGWWIAGGLAVLAAGAGYYFMVVRRANED